jgi:hypothetical protein
MAGAGEQFELGHLLTAQTSSGNHSAHGLKKNEFGFTDDQVLGPNTLLATRITGVALVFFGFKLAASEFQL